MDSEEVWEWMKESREDAIAITNSAMSFVMSRAEMLQCSPVVCLMVLKILTERNIEGHLKMATAAACKMSNKKLDPDMVEREMRKAIKKGSELLSAGTKTKKATFDG